MISMENSSFVYVYEGKPYNVFVVRRRQSNIYYRIKEDGFHVSCPRFTFQENIIRGLNKFAGKLIARFEASNNNISTTENTVYLLGEKYAISALNLKNTEELQRFLKKKSKEILTEIVREKEQEMGIKKPYKITVRNMTTRFGSNSRKTHRLSFQISLIHFSREIIESVVVHELAHYFYMDHQKKFYEVVYKYCPNYDVVQRKLKKGIHKWFAKLIQDKTKK